jgi:poly-gamma-glutamate synthesis protein (capsule biosynthesis protein)
MKRAGKKISLDYFNKFSLLVFITIVVFLVLVYSIATAPTKTPPIFSFLNFGDVMFDRGVRNIVDKGIDPFVNIKKEESLLKPFDFFIVNLEGPIVEMDRSLCQQKAYNFQFPNNTGSKLNLALINIVNIANNHSYDCYREGFNNTKNILNKSGISFIGDMDLNKSYVIKEVNGMKVAFVGMDETIGFVPISNFYPLIKKLKSENDFVVVNIHWGTEYMLHSNKNQEGIAHSLIDNGADIIMGHHPHVIEEVEKYKKGIIFYSLGNFVFDQDFENTTTGLGVKTEFYKDRKVFTLYPFKIEKFVPNLLSGREKENFCKKYLLAMTHNGCYVEM